MQTSFQIKWKASLLELLLESLCEPQGFISHGVSWSLHTGKSLQSICRSNNANIIPNQMESEFVRITIGEPL